MVLYGSQGENAKEEPCLQIAFGSGFNCNSAVWEALRNVKPSPNSPWEDCIHMYPVQTVAYSSTTIRLGSGMSR
jgi:hypothetical protein